jgi:NAD(P)-dependent dehydrogenase (short-subunit alcohol dehydrogenase family)
MKDENTASNETGRETALDWLGLAGKIVCITGAGGGIGRACALAFAKAGAIPVLMDRNSESLEETASQFALQDRQFFSIPCDVGDHASIQKAVAQTKTLTGGCDILINNAAIMRPGGLDSLSLADWNTQIAINLTGYFLMAQSLFPQMRQRDGGSIIHIASTSATHPQGESGAYSVCKAGILMLSRQLAVEWGPVGIRSNVVSPGMVETPLSRAFYEAPEIRKKRENVVPVRRIGQSSDMADAALFLASRRSSYISGEEITVDGGFTRMIMNLIPRPGFQSAV